MSIEKKSLISNRTATKKAIVTKPEVAKVASPRTTVKARTTLTHARLALPNTRMKLPNTRMTLPNTRMTLPNTKIKI